MMIRVAAQALGLALLKRGHRAKPPSLFKIVTAKDDVVIGVAGTDLDALAKRLVADGQITVWQYAVHKAASGDRSRPRCADRHPAPGYAADRAIHFPH